MKKWNLVVDIAKCTNCNLCALACQDEHVGNAFPGYAAEMPKHGANWIRIERSERGQGDHVEVAYMPIMCQHCDEAPCIEAAENGAVAKRPDGIVIIDPDKAKGQRQLVDSCPYGAIGWNEALDLPQHWIFDAHLLDEGWQEPRAVTVCATGALRAVKCDDLEISHLIDEEGLEAYQPAFGTRPRVHYKNLHRVTKAFVAGSIEITSGDTTDCIAGAEVRLLDGATEIASTETDVFGDFKFDGLEADGAGYTVEVRAEGKATKSVPVTMTHTVVLGDIQL